jgi:hypothetical protein
MFYKNLLSPSKYAEGAPITGRKRALCGERKANMMVDEGRKGVLLIAASVLAARKLAQYEGTKRVPATISAIADAVRWAEEIMKAIDARWPTAQ